MRKHPFFIGIIAMMLGSCMHTARDRKLAELITDNMNSGDLVFYNGWAQDVKLQYVQEITLEQRITLNIAYCRYRQRVIADSVKTMTTTMMTVQTELEAYEHQPLHGDTAQRRIADLTGHMAALKVEIPRMNELLLQNAKTTDSLRTLKIEDRHKFGGYRIGLTYNRVKSGVKTPGTTEKLVTEDWRCQSLAGKD